MRTDRLPRGLGLSALGLLLAGACWLRLTSYNTAPEFSADESLNGLQIVRILRGEPYYLGTPTGHLLSPVLMALQAPLLVAFEPSSAILRLPVTVCGLLAVWSLYRLGARTFDRPTGLLAAGLLAVLPVAIIQSRIAWEPGLIPLFAVLGLALAYRGRCLGVLALLPVGYFLVHPTTIMLAPILTSVLLAQVVRRTHDRPVVRWRAPLLTLAGAAAVIVPIVLACRSSFGADWARTAYDIGPCDWGRFLALYGRTLLGLELGVPPERAPWYDWAFWSVVAVVSLLGLERLLQRRAWDQLVLVGPTIATLVGLYVVVGPHVVHPGASRYTLFLLVPMVLSLACLARTLLVEPATSGLAALRGVQGAACLAIGFALLATAKVHYIDRFRTEEPGAGAGWPRLVRGEEIKPLQRITELIERDSRRGPDAGRPRQIASARYHVGQPIEFLVLRRPELQVVYLDELAPPELARTFIDVLRTGGYVVNFVDLEAHRQILDAFSPGSLQVWFIPTVTRSWYFVYRLRGDVEIAARRSVSPG